MRKTNLLIIINTLIHKKKNIILIYNITIGEKEKRMDREKSATLSPRCVVVHSRR